MGITTAIGAEKIRRHELLWWNVNAFYGMSMLYGSMALAIPAFTPLLTSHGFSAGGLLYLQAAFIVLLGLLQAPTGYLADQVGRKSCIVAGTLVWTGGLVLYALGEYLWAFVAAELVLGVGSALIAGADIALVRDSLEELGEPLLYRRVISRTASYGRVVETILFALGGWLMLYGLRAPFYVALVGHVALIIFALSLHEPLRKRVQRSGTHRAEIIRVIRLCLFENRLLAWLIGFQALVLSFTLAGFWFTALLLKETGVSVAWYGLGFAALSVVTAFSSFISNWLEERFGNLVFVLITASLCFGFLLPAFGGLLCAVIGMALQKVAAGSSIVLLSHRIAEAAPQEVRATVISVGGMVLNFAQCLVLVGSGLLVDSSGSVSFTFGVMGVVTVVVGVPLLFLLPFKEEVQRQEVQYEEDEVLFI